MSVRIRARRAFDLPTSDLRRAFVTFRPALRGQRGRVAVGVVLAVLVTGLELARPWPITWVVDHLTGPAAAGADGTAVAGNDLAPILVFAGIAFVIPVLSGFVGEQLELVTARISRSATVRIRSDVFDHLQRLELAEHQQHYRGDLLMRLMGDVNMIRDLLFPTWLQLLRHGSVLVGGAIVFAVVDWRLFCVALIPLPLLWASVERGSSAIKAAARKQRRKEGRIASSAAESLRQVGIIKAFSAEERMAVEFRSSAKQAEKATMAAARQSALMARRTEVLTGAGVALVLVFGAMRTRSGLLTTGELVLAISYTRMIYKPLRKITGEGARVAKATACALRVIDLYDRPVENPDRGRPVDDLGGPIDFVHVTHTYPDGRTSIEGLTVRIPGGAFVAVTGENGTGKSTLLSLLLRLVHPSAGEIRIGDVPIDELRLVDYRSQIAYVPQELALFGGSIRENIVFGRPEASDAEIRAAVEAALLAPVLDSLPAGIDTVLDEDGSSLSGGQARRVMLARAAVRNAPVLLLDEPLTGLDPDARALVARAIRNIASGRTTLVVHHGALSELGPDHHLDLDVLRRRPVPAFPPDAAMAGR